MLGIQNALHCCMSRHRTDAVASSWCRVDKRGNASSRVCGDNQFPIGRRVRDLVRAHNLMTSYIESAWLSDPPSLSSVFIKVTRIDSSLETALSILAAVSRRTLPLAALSKLHQGSWQQCLLRTLPQVYYFLKCRTTSLSTVTLIDEMHDHSFIEYRFEKK
jgi:hypothetical protein